MSAALVKTALYNILGGLAGIDAARVYKSQKLLLSDKQCHDVLCGPLATDKTVNAWFMSVTGFGDTMASMGQTGMNKALYQVKLLGFNTVNLNTTPTSEENFETLCESIRDGVAGGMRAQLATIAAGGHVDEFPKFLLEYVIVPLAGGELLHKATATMSVEIWHARG